MKLTQVILFVLTPVAIFMLLARTAKAAASIPVIYETDMCLDVDDVGALAVLHGLQNEGKVNILAVCFNEVHPSGAAAIDAINTWYGRGDIPVGVYKSRLSNPDRSRYLEALTTFPHDLDNERAASALDTYRQVLADQPDRSVTIISVGFLNNLYDLLKDPEGYALVEKKVKLLVAMGGLNDDGFNFVRHGLMDQTQYVIENWPGTLVTTHVGGSMITGQTLTATTPVNNPVRRAYELHRGPNTGRSSWDQVSVLYAVYGTQWFNETWAGGGSLRNRYTWTFKKGYRGYAAPNDDSQVKDEIERLMILAPYRAASVETSMEPQGTRPRVIVMTDGEVDDRSSMIRFLLYTCDVDVRAIIETNSMFQRHGHSDKKWIEAQLAAYEELYPNLIKHHPGYPTADELRARSFVGDEDFDHLKGTRETRWEQIPGGPVEFDPAGWPDTPGSDTIVRILLQDDPAPIHLQAWGGGNTASRAFYKLKRDHPADYERAISKVVMYNIWYQDDAGNYIETHHPKVTMIYCGHFAGTWNYRSQPDTHDFITRHVKNGHGPLGALYPQTYVSEGDSPAFFYVIANGLRNHEHPGFGGWGGRFKKVEGFERVYIDAEDEGGKKYQFARWIDAVNRDFQARMDWCVKDFKEANHPPVVKLAHARDLKVRPGESVSLSAKGTTDPDGDEVVFHWWQYCEAGSYDGSIEIRDAGKQDASFTVPRNVDTGETIHVICEVTDTGTPPLTRYQRVIVEVKP